jgi:hypothetical protein
LSFDLFVYFTPPASGLKERWEGALADEGLPLRFPDGVDLLAPGEDLNVTWTAAPRSIRLEPGETLTGFPYYEVCDVAIEDDDMQRVPPLLRSGVEGATHEAFFTTSAGRSADGFALQVLGAATLAKATGGIVLDPQERGYLSADEALAYAHGSLEAYRAATASQQVKRAERIEELDRRWHWFRTVFFANWAVWAFIVAFLFVLTPLKVDVSAPWVPVVTLVPFLAAVVFATRSTRYFLETAGVPWPLPWVVGVASAFPPFHTITYWWARKRYGRLRAA